MTLFDAAARFDARMPPGSMALFLDSLSGQEIAGDTLAERSQSGDAVTICTAHRAKGLEWDLVVVAGVAGRRLARPAAARLAARHGPARRGRGPGRRRRARPDPAPTRRRSRSARKLLDEERRLFYVAVTRARRWLVVTAVGGDDTEERPSRFLAELAGDEIEIEEVPRLGTALALAARADRRPAPGRLRPGAARAGSRRPRPPSWPGSPRRASPAPSPDQWYALTPWSGTGPISDGEVRVSPSQVDKFVTCGLRWLIESAVGASPPSVAGHLGTVIHAAAALVAEGADRADIAGRIDEIWHQLDFGSVWYNAKQRGQRRRRWSASSSTGSGRTAVS